MRRPKDTKESFFQADIRPASPGLSQRRVLPSEKRWMTVVLERRVHEAEQPNIDLLGYIPVERE